MEKGIGELAPYAAEVGVKLAIEPFHPVLMQERSVIVTLAQALDIARGSSPTGLASSSMPTTSGGIPT